MNYDIKKMGLDAYKLLEEISFNRMGGTDDELKAANIIIDKAKDLGLEAYLEPFKIEVGKVNLAKLEVLEPVYKEYVVAGFGLSGKTGEDGIEAEFLYGEDGIETNLWDAEGKIVLINGAAGSMPVKAYENLIKAKAKAFIATSGDIYEKVEESDLIAWDLRPRHLKYGSLPGVAIRPIDAQELVLSKPTKVRLTLLEEKVELTSNNVICEIKGKKYPEQYIAVTAHYDSVIYSSGAYDNGTGSVTIFELMKYFANNRPDRSLKFIWCGSEELGLLGSKDFCEKHKEDLDKYLFCINFDMTGVVLGKEIAVCTSEDKLVGYVEYLAKEVGFPLICRQGVYSSDSTPFADAGVPSITFARISSRGGAVIHSRKDVIDYIKPEYLETTINFALTFTNRVSNAVVFPVTKVIPQNMKDELDKYNNRKD